MIILDLLRIIRKKYLLNLYRESLNISSNSILSKTFGFNIFYKNNNIRLSIGQSCIIGGYFLFESDSGFIEVGDNTYIGDSKFICKSRIIIGNNVTIAWGCTIYDHNSHSLNHLERRNDIRTEFDNLKKGNFFLDNKNWKVVKSLPITIEDDVWIGMNVIILKGVKIGKGAVVAAGSVVTKDVPAWSVVAGNPAMVVKSNINTK